MIRNTPPLGAIETFIEAAKGQSFRTVASQMALSPSAVSRQIAKLETFLGVSLFDRANQTQTLSAAGIRYLALIDPAVGAIKRATTMLSACEGDRLRVATSHSFASAWLMPRLPELLNEYDIHVEIIPTRKFDALRCGEAQIGIWGGLAVPADLTAERLFDVEAFPVCAARLIDGGKPPEIGASLANYPLLSVNSPTGMWERWFALGGHGNKPCQVRVREYETLHMMYEATVAGLGVSLAMPLVSEQFLGSGKLIRCGDGPRRIGESYQLFRTDHLMKRSPIEQRFVRWLHGAVNKSLQTFADSAPSRDGRSAQVAH